MGLMVVVVIVVILTGEGSPRYETSRYFLDLPTFTSGLSKGAPLTLILKTSGSTKSTSRPGKGGVGVGGDAGDNGGHDDCGSRSSDSNRNSSDVPKSMCPPTSLTSMLKTSLSIDSLASAAQIVVEFDGVDAGGGGNGKSVEKLVEKSSKSQRIVKSWKTSRAWKSCKGHRFGGTFTKAPLLWHLDRALIVFWALFAGPKSSLDTTFGAIIIKAKLIELLMLYHFFAPKELVCTKFLSRPPSAKF